MLAEEGEGWSGACVIVSELTPLAEVTLDMCSGRG